MSINPLLTNYGPGASLYAPSGGGGGGGGAGPNLTLSTLTLASSADLAPSILSPGASSQININANGGVIFGDVPPNLGASVNIYGGTGQIWCEDQGANVVLQILPDVSTGKCTVTQGVGGTGIALVNISSINGAAPGSGAANPNPTFSTVTASTINSGILFLENINAAGQYPYRMRANSGTAFIENSATGEPGDLTVSTLTVSSINNGPSIATLFANLFAANPTLSTIVY